MLAPRHAPRARFHVGMTSGRYDYDFMDYTIRILYKCKEYGFKVYMDPHQDAVCVLFFALVCAF